MKQSAQKAAKQSESFLSLSNPKNILIVSLVVLVAFLVWYRTDDKQGTNTKTPIVEESCPLKRDPVCGTDGKTYSNACTAEKVYKTSVAHSGECSVDSGVSTGSQEVSTVSVEEEWAEVDSGIENLAQVPTLSGDRPTADMATDGTTASGATQSGTLIEYSNPRYGYAFNMPKKSYYSAFGAQDGASHTVGIATGTGVESFADAPVRVYFYANKVINELKTAPNGFYTDRTTGAIYLLLDNTSSVRIESDDGENEIVKTIVRTIRLIP